MFTEDAFGFADYNVFTFEGKTYFDLWWKDSSDFNAHPNYESRRLRVFMAEKGKIAEVCSYRFKWTESKKAV